MTDGELDLEPIVWSGRPRPIASECFAETAALVAMMNGDDDEARRILDDFYPYELEKFEEHLSNLERLTFRLRKRKESGCQV